MKLHLIASMVWIFMVTFVGCSTNEPTEPIAGETSYVGIDPDQKAAPKDSAGDMASNPVFDTTLDGKGEKLVDGVQAPPAPSSAVSTPEPTPAVEEITTAPAAPLDTSPNDSTNAAGPGGVAVGRGSQKRFIKAWERNIRSQPNRYSKIVGLLKGGDQVNVTIRGGWAKLDDGQWIRSRWLVKSAPKKFVGGPGDSAAPVAKKKSKHVKKVKRRNRSTGSNH